MSTAPTSQCVLLVDDDRDFLDQTQLRLQNAGYEVVRAESLAEARDLLGSARIAIAIVDLMMETNDSGFTLCHEIKQTHPALPIIMVTGVAAETGLEFAAATAEERSWIKADVVLNKPVRFEQLQQQIQRLLLA